MKDSLSSEEWLAYFISNEDHFSQIPWYLGVDLTSQELQVITPSIQGFQLGENSEGRHLYQFARNYSLNGGDLAYVDCVKYFIREEQRHSLVLLRFMELAGINPIKKNNLDCIFRYLRRFAGLELSVSVLLSAELIAMIYYDALSRATNSELLKTLCWQILKDEENHILFQVNTLSKLRKKKSSFLLLMGNLLYKLFFTATSIAVYVRYKGVFQGSYNLKQYWLSCQREYKKAMRLSSKEYCRNEELELAGT